NAEQTSEAGIDCLGEISFEGLARNIPEGIWMIDLYYDSRKILPVNYAVFSDGVSLRFLCGGSTKAFCPVGSMCAIPDIHVSDYDGVCVNLDSVSESAAGSSTTIPEASSSTTLAYSTTLPTTSMVRIPFTPSPATSTMRIPFTPSPASSSGTPVIEIIEAQFDAPGSEKINLNGEWVKIRNNGDAPQDLTGWILEDDANHIYRFPDNFVLGTGDSVTVHTGSGTDSTSDLYWGRGSAIWNNDGDTATLRDEEGRKIDSHEE
ncbi:MAG: lamin tail domain-containing protein, partial [Candidatus Altiarchaeota archaeon]